MKVSIITVCKNSDKTIEQSIISVLNQKDCKLEYIIIDGFSNDRTVDIIKKYEKSIDYWHSKKDTGIYHAMNIGIRKSTGDIVFFLNADDYLYDNRIISKVVTLYIKNNYPDMLYGKVLYKNEEVGISFIKGDKLDKKSLRKGSIPPHQAVFMKKEVLELLNGFNLEYQSASDVDLIIRYSKLNRKTIEIPFIVSVFRHGGYSSNRTENYKEIKKILKINYCKYWMIVFTIRRLIFERLIKFVITKLGLLPMWYKLYFIYNSRKKRLLYNENISIEL